MKKILILSFFIIFLGVGFVHAQPTTTGEGGTNTNQNTTTTGEGGTNQNAGDSIRLANPLEGGEIDSIPKLIEEILKIVISIGVPIIALAIIYAGFKFIAAQGNPEKLKEAKQTLIYVVIGSAILLAAYAIASAIGATVESLRG